MCVRRAALQECAPETILLGQVDERGCGIGSTCVSAEREDFEYCAPHPFRIALLEQIEPSEQRAESSPSLAQHIYETFLDQRLSPLLRLADLEVELDYLTFPRGDESAALAALERLAASDTDVVITNGNEAYSLAASSDLLRAHRMLVLGAFNRGASHIIPTFGEVAPPLSERWDFSIAPLPFNDQATDAAFLSEEVRCLYLVDVDNADSEIAELTALIDAQEAPRHGMCATRIILPNASAENSSFSPIFDQLDSINDEDFCVRLSSSDADTVLAVLDGWEEHLMSRERSPRLTFLLDKKWLLEENTEERARIAELLSGFYAPHSIFFSYEPELPALNEVVGRYIAQDYSPFYHALGCTASDTCDLLSPEVLRSQALAVGLHIDLIVVATLALHRTHVFESYRVTAPGAAHSPRGERADATREDLRDAYLDITREDTSQGPCDFDKLSTCFTLQRANERVRYNGLASSMTLGADGRMNSLHEELVYERFDNGGGLIESKKFSNDEMRTNALAPFPSGEDPCD